VRFRQIVVNLIGNAVKFTSDGSVAVKLALSHAGGKSMILVEVADTGIGIAPEVAPRLFIPFSQADASTTRRFGGTGLGLAISKQLVELMGGEIGVTSQLDHGSVFWFTIPYQPETLAPLATPVARQASGLVFPHRILVAEDNAINRRLAERMLGGMGCRVECAINGAEAVTAMQTKSYDIVFMDCQMPVMDGYEAVEKFRLWESNQASERHLPIYALTASAMPDERDRCIRSGMDGCLAKPVKRDFLEAVLRKVVVADTIA
jgi:CheY-like chemotaxis protein